MIPGAPAISALTAIRKLIPGEDDHLTQNILISKLAMLFRGLGVSAELAEGVNQRTVRYYRQRKIVDEPSGKTSKARYGRRHLAQLAMARLVASNAGLTLDDCTGFAMLSDEAICDEIDRLVAHLKQQRVAMGLPPITPQPKALEHQVREPPKFRSIDLGDGAYALIPTEHPALRGEGGGVLRDSLREVMQVSSKS